MTTTYLLDSNVLITPYNSYYPFDFAPSFWTFITEKTKKGDIISIDKVSDEIIRGEDDLANWFGKNIKQYCINTEDTEIMFVY